MGMSWAELVMRRRNVAEFIRADSHKITITRKGEPTRTEAGGKKPGSVKTLPPQTVRIVQNFRRYTDGLVNSEAGDIPNGVYLLVGRHNLDLIRDDIFDVVGEKYIVLGVSQLRRKELTLATLDLHGPPNIPSVTVLPDPDPDPDPEPGP